MEIQCSLYRIREGTKQEFVTVHSNGNVVRWKELGDSNQDWLVLPIGKNRYKFLICQPNKREANECMSVGSNGNILRWEPTGRDEQIFSFSDESDGWCSIREHTRNEYVSVGSNGNILRWTWTGRPEQKFKLEPKSSPKEPEPRKGDYEPRQIPDIPRLTDFRNPPKRSDYYLISEMVYPAFFVNDDRYRSKVVQVESNPFYLLRREQYWSNEYYHEYDGKVEVTKETKIKVGIKNVTSQSMEHTVGMKVAHNYEFGFNPELEVEGIAIKGQNMKQSFSSELTNQLKLSRTQESTELKESEEMVRVVFPKGKRYARALWILCDRFTLLDQNNSVVGQWEVRRNDTIVEDSYPKD